jgi:hypothetical protein
VKNENDLLLRLVRLFSSSGSGHQLPLFAKPRQIHGHGRVHYDSVGRGFAVAVISILHEQRMTRYLFAQMIFAFA